jgi:hypothetical protein
MLFYTAQIIFTQPGVISDYSVVYPYKLASQTKGKMDLSNGERWINLVDGVRNQELRFQMRRVVVKDGIRGNTDNFINNVKKSGSKIVSVKEVVTSSSSPPMVDEPSLGVETKYLFHEEFRIFILGSSKLYKLSNINDPKLLSRLTDLLNDPGRAWAAHILLSKMMGLSGLTSSVQSISSSKWWQTEGQTGKAQREWRIYLEQVKSSMNWNPYGGYYQHRRPDGSYIL